MDVQPSPVSPSGRLAVSVVIPAFNVAPYLEEAIASVRRQTVPPDEIIIVDDQSTDGTWELAQTLGATALRTGHNAGAGRARNLGIRASAGDVVAFLDADDIWEPWHCEELVRLLQEFPDVGIVFGHVRTFGTRSEDQRRLLPHATPVNLWPAIVDQNYIPQTACAVRRHLLMQVGGYDETFRRAQDYDLWMRLARMTLVACTHRQTVRYRAQSNAGARSSRRNLEAQVDARAKLLATLVAEGSPDVPVVSTRFREAWAGLLQEAWRAADRDGWEAVLDMARAVPGSEAVAWSMRRRRAIWPAWKVLTRARAAIKAVLARDTAVRTAGHF